MGEVYRAHDPRLARDVALKVLPADMAADPARLERFTREARAIAALNHPHIVTIYSTEEADGVRFLTMELVEGQSLDALIPAGGLPLARFFDVALPLADALTAAHQKQITHRDLKPANVMVASDGRVKVLDFGLASAPAKPGAHIGDVGPGFGDVGPGFSPADMVTSPQITTPGMVIGTMPYMSPEQVEGKQLDHRTDLFSLGVMFHELLVGARPFTGSSSPQLMSSILRDTPSSASDLRPEVPDVESS
jgi:serine/threonine protein kinase